MSLFPFTLGDSEGERLFHLYLDKHLTRIRETHGGWWGWECVRVVATSPTTVNFTTYDGTTVTLDEFATCKPEALADIVERRKRDLAGAEVARRREAVAKAVYEAEVDVVYKELFP